MIIILKIIGAILGIILVGAGFYLIINDRKKREILGSLSAIAGFLIFCLSMLLMFVPDFFTSG